MKSNKARPAALVQPARDGRLARKRYSFRLPLALAPRLEALCEMYPEKTRPQLIGDVLGLGMAEVERVWSGVAGGQTGFHPDTRQPIYLLTGPFSEFHGLVHKHHLAMEHELAQEDPQALYPVDDYMLDDVE